MGFAACSSAGPRKPDGGTDATRLDASPTIDAATWPAPDTRDGSGQADAKVAEMETGREAAPAVPPDARSAGEAGALEASARDLGASSPDTRDAALDGPDGGSDTAQAGGWC